MYGPDTLLLASKKPHVQALVQRVSTMTVDEIHALPEKKDVIRGLLLIKQFGMDGPKATVYEKIANVMAANSVAQLPTAVVCDIYQITSGEFWLKTGASELLVQPKWYWASCENGEIIISNIRTSAIKDRIRLLISNSQFIQTSNTNDFAKMEDARRNSLV
jgi:hypothetical protein